MRVRGYGVRECARRRRRGAHYDAARLMADRALLLLAEKKLSKLSSLFVEGSQFVSYSTELDVDALLESHPDLVVLHKAGYDCVLSADDA